jgi:hypothetical protein
MTITESMLGKHMFVWGSRIALVLLSFTFLLGAAFGQCVQPPEEGRWRNADPNSNSLTRIQLRFVCQDQILNGQPYPPGPPWYVHIFGKCSPTDCDWNEVGATRLSSGFVYAVYDQGFAKRYVYAKMSAYRPGQLWVYAFTDFTDPGRPDYVVNNWFVRE